jgi:hypothetical protein
MDPLERGILMIVRMVAATLMLWSVMDLSVDSIQFFHNHKFVSLLTWLLDFLPLPLGIVAMARARALAHWVCNKLE